MVKTIVKVGDRVIYQDSYAGRFHTIRGTVTNVYARYFDMVTPNNRYVQCYLSKIVRVIG